MIELIIISIVIFSLYGNSDKATAKGMMLYSGAITLMILDVTLNAVLTFMSGARSFENVILVIGLAVCFKVFVIITKNFFELAKDEEYLRSSRNKTIHDESTL